MRLSTQTSVLAARFGYVQAIRMIAEAGFDCFDLSMGSAMRDHDDDPLNLSDWQKTVLAMKSEAEHCGICCNQAHAPFRLSFGSPDTAEKDRVMEERIHRSIRIAAMMGAKTIVVHPMRYDDDVDKMRQESVAFIRRLLPDCEQHGISLAIENIKTTASAELLCRVIDEVNSPFAVACLDIGHAYYLGQDGAEMIRSIGPGRLQALHIHDNDFAHDSHTMPFLGKIPFPQVMTALKETGYRGDFTFEADCFLQHLPDEALPAALRLLHDVGRHLIGL